MASEQFSLCWDNFHRNMSSGMNSLLQSEDLVDVTLAVEGRYLKAHKMILSVCSPYFHELFKVNPCKHPIVFLKDVSYTAMSDLLQFMYQGEVQVSQENLTTFIKTAEALQIKGLTGDGNGTTEGDSELLEESSQKLDIPVVKQSTSSTSRQKRAHHQHHQIIATQSLKKARVSSPQTKPVVAAAATAASAPSVSSSKTESGAATASELIQFKMEPAEGGQGSMVADDGADETFDENLDDNVDDSTAEEYAMVEASEEPQAGTSADGAIPGEGQEVIQPLFLKNKRGYSVMIIDGFHFQYHQVYKDRVFWRCYEHKRLKCRARGMTRDQILQAINDEHNHEPPPPFIIN